MNEKISKKSFINREELHKKIQQALIEKKNKNTKNINELKKDLKIETINQNVNFNTIVRASNARNNNMAQLVRKNVGLNEIKDLLKKIDVFFDDNCSAYMALGGIGDLLLILATCYDQKNPKVLFLANNPASVFVKNLFKFFNIPHLIHKNLMGTHWCNLVYDKFIKMPSFKTSAHLADGLNYGDWYNLEKYAPRIRNNTNWDELVGHNKLFSEKYVILCPSGSWKNESRRRYLSLEEYRIVVTKLLQKKYKIVTTSDENDLKTYGLFPNQNCVWMTNNHIISFDGSKKEIDFKTFLQTINSANQHISMDTYLKTLVLLMNKEVKVIKTRFNGNYLEDGVDSSDKIFLDKTIWPKVKTYKLDELFQEIEMF